MNPHVPAVLLVFALLITACSDSSDDGGNGGADNAGGDQAFPDVVDVEVERTGHGTYDFAVTISSPYDTPERYADGWRVIGPDGTVYGTHELAHDHAAEQPFTRTQSGVHVPDGVEEVVVEGHDLANGYGGETVTVSVPDE